MNPPKKEAKPPPPPPAYNNVNNVFVRRNPYFLRPVQSKQSSSYTNKHKKLMHSGLVERRR